MESLEARQLLSATPQIQILNDATTNLAYRYSEAGAAQGSYALGAANATPRGAASAVTLDQTWVLDANRNVYVYDATSGGLLGAWAAGSMPNNATPEGIATNGTDIWIVDAKTDKVHLYAGAASRLSGSQAAASSFNLASGNANPKDMVSDGGHLWIVDDTAKTDRVFKYAVDGTFVGSWTIDAANKTPTGITLDPGKVGDVWIADSGTDRVYKYAAAASRDFGSQAAASNFALAAGNSNPQALVIPGRPWAEASFGVDWVRQLGSAGDEIGLGVAVDGSGGTYVSGRTNGSVVAPNTTGGNVSFLARYDEDANFDWAEQGQTSSGAIDVQADAFGNVYHISDDASGYYLKKYDVSGTLQWTTAFSPSEWLYGVAVDNQGYAYTATYIGGGSSWGNVIRVRKHDPATGSILWETPIDFGASTAVWGIATDGLGNVVVGGYTSGSAFAPNAGATDGWVAKLTSAGGLLWGTQFGSTTTDDIWGVAADGLGNVYSVGTTFGSLGAPYAGGSDIFVTKHDAGGNHQWTRQLGSSVDESLNSVWADAAGNVYASGWTRGALGGPNLGGPADALLVKYDSAGSLKWAKQFGSSGRDSANAIVGDAEGNIYLAGNTRGSWGAPNAGGADFVVMKLSAPAAAAAAVALSSADRMPASVETPPKAIDAVFAAGDFTTLFDPTTSFTRSAKARRRA